MEGVETKRAKASNVRPFQCANCDKAFTRQENLKRHVNTHHRGFNAKSFPCSLCNARFARSDLRKRHVENCHIQTTPISKDATNAEVLASPTADLSSPSAAWLDMLMAPTQANPPPAVEQNRSRYQETWVFQTFLLLEFVGIYGGNDANFLKAQRIHRDLVDAMRMLEMSHDGTAGGSFSRSPEDSEEEDEDQESFDGPEFNEGKWKEFIKHESRKRCIYILYILDSHLSILCNLRPMLSSLEIKYDLPCCEDMWLARTAEEWSICQKQQFKSFNDYDDESYTQESPPSQGSFYEASQTLLHSDQEKKHPRKLRLLWASPFAAVILVMQLQMMARELTHASCLLERPKSQRRTLSVLTDKQHSQISQALKGIAELVPRNQKPSFNFFDVGRIHDYPEPQKDTPLWHTFWILWYYTSISLSHPDSLLVSGIVEVNLPLAIATAGHLATPRSKDKRDIYEDRDVFRILNDLELALEMLNPSTSNAVPALENAFITLLGFKICLVGWRLVRLTMVEAADAVKRGVRSDPCKFVLDAIMSCTDANTDALLLDQTDLMMPRETARSEVAFLEWIVETFNKRSSWPVGKWITAVMEERLALAKEVYASTAKPAS
ncbi:elongation factor 1-gamma [Phlyctema vagabunda]|uniref:Elongation factor 1-gamma n=1 Tax=Phlyctema vagabunda TaxID=108571 RepID=A0ABR4P5D1_9HELO